MENIQWSDVSKQLIWKNQLDLFAFSNQTEITNDSEIMKKASAWFRVTYKWLHSQMKKIRTNNKRKRKNRMPNTQQQGPNKPQPLLSFAWIVYPVLMKIYDNKQESKHMREHNI